MVGKSVGATAYIPGGRMPPNFASVIAGRTYSPSAVRHAGVGANAARNATNQDHVFAAGANQHTMKSGHVFIPPVRMAPPSMGPGMPMGGPGPAYGVSSGARPRSRLRRLGTPVPPDTARAMCRINKRGMF